MTLSQTDVEAIYNDIVTNCIKEFNEGNGAALSTIYAQKGVLINGKSGDHAFGLEAIRTMLEPYAALGQIDCKLNYQKVTVIGTDKFHVIAESHNTIVATGQILVAHVEQLFGKDNGTWKCFYETFQEA